jgi:hypothetical protein
MDIQRIGGLLGASLLIFVGATPAAAGVWNLGCKGSIGNSTLTFDRYALVIMPKKLASGDFRGLANGNIEIFALSKDSEGDGFQPMMEFTSSAYEGQKIILTEKRSEKLSEKSGHVGSRQETTQILRKTYNVKQISPRELPEGDSVMDCVDYQLTAP